MELKKPHPSRLGEAQTHTARLLTQPHQSYNWNREQPSLRTVRNRVEWKSDNYRVKETTSIETGRRGADTEWADLSPMCGGWKFGRVISGESRPRPTPGPPAQGSSARKISPLNFWLQKPVDIELVKETTGAPSSSSLKTHTQNYSDSVPATGWQLERHQWHTSVWHVGGSWE